MSTLGSKFKVVSLVLFILILFEWNSSGFIVTTTMTKNFQFDDSVSNTMSIHNLEEKHDEMHSSSFQEVSAKFHAETNAQFDSLRATHGFPGSGTDEFPYVISGFNFSSEDSFPISFRGVTYSILIAGNNFNNGGIRISGSNQVTIRNNVLGKELNFHGEIFIESVQNNQVFIEGNSIDRASFRKLDKNAIRIINSFSANVSITNNTILTKEPESSGIRIDSYNGGVLRIAGNQIETSSFSAYAVDIATISNGDLQIANNELITGGTGSHALSFTTTSESSISVANNSILTSGAEASAFRSVSDSRTTSIFINNSISTNSEASIRFYGRSQGSLEISNNTILSNLAGIQVGTIENEPIILSNNKILTTGDSLSTIDFQTLQSSSFHAQNNSIMTQGLAHSSFSISNLLQSTVKLQWNIVTSERNYFSSLKVVDATVTITEETVTAMLSGIEVDESMNSMFLVRNNDLNVTSGAGVSLKNVRDGAINVTNNIIFTQADTSTGLYFEQKTDAVVVLANNEIFSDSMQSTGILVITDNQARRITQSNNTVSQSSSSVEGYFTYLTQSNSVFSISKNFEYLFNTSDPGRQLEWYFPELQGSGFYTINEGGITLTNDWVTGKNITISLSEQNFTRSIRFSLLLSLTLDGNTRSAAITLNLENDAEIVITAVDRQNATFGVSNILLNWTVIDLGSSGQYQVFQDNSQVKAGTWTHNISVFLILNNLEVKEYVFSLFASSETKATVSHSILLSVFAPNLPIEISQSNNVTYAVGTSGNIIEWVVTTPGLFGSYGIRMGTSIHIRNRGWVSETPIKFNVDGYSVGTYNFTIFILEFSRFSEIATSSTIFVFVVIPQRPLPTSTTESITSSTSTSTSDDTLDQFIFEFFVTAGIIILAIILTSILIFSFVSRRKRR